MDSSFTVTVDDYRKEKDFVKRLADMLNVVPGKSRSSLITYGTNPVRVFGLGQYQTTKDFKDRVDRAPTLGGLRRIDRAFTEAANELRRSPDGGSKVVVLLTAGRQTPGAQELGSASKPLRDLGAAVYAVAIGSQPDNQELLPAVQKPENIFRVPSSSELLNILWEISKNISKTPSKTKEIVKNNFIFLCHYLMFGKLTFKSTFQSTDVPCRTYQHRVLFGNSGLKICLTGVVRVLTPVLSSAASNHSCSY